MPGCVFDTDRDMMTPEVSEMGLPGRGSFSSSDNQDAIGQPLGTYSGGQWQVDPSLNRVVQREGHAYRCYEERPSSYDAMVRYSAAREPERVAVVCGDRRVTYAEFDELVSKTAFGLIQAGLTPGDRVAVMLDNRLEYLVAMLGCVRAGGIAIPLGTRLGPSDVAHIVGDAAPVIVVTASEWVGKFDTSAPVENMFVVDVPVNGTRSFSELLNSAPQRLPELDADEVMMIIYTSGTTGKPKGACLTHFNFVHTCLHYLYSLAIDEPLTSLLVIPGTHIAGFGPLVSVTLASAGTVVLVRDFDSDKVLETIEKEKITYAVMVPAMYQLLVMRSPVADYDISAWKYGVYGGAIMPPATIARFREVAPGLRMINAYGATETCAVSTIIPSELTEQFPESVGMALECDEIIIVDEHGNQVADGEPGELWIKGPNISPGYWNSEEMTKKSFQDGYWKSGDIGRRDSSGLIYVIDRLKDMINRGGFKVFSAEVENALMTHDRVLDCAVVGVPDPVLGEKTFAFVTTDAEGPTAADLRDYLVARIADYKVPDHWWIGEREVPRNQNGKVQKAEVRKFADELLSV